MSDDQLIATTPSAPWLPSGSTAEVWAGADCGVPEPCIIVRLLLFRRDDRGEVQFFCVPTHRGLDLPTLPLGSGSGRVPPAEGLARLAKQIIGRTETAAYPCIGYVRNVVPYADDSYPHPTPWAHVPVFAREGAEPVVDGTWVTLVSAWRNLSVRHWWPIVEHHLRAVPERS